MRTGCVILGPRTRLGEALLESLPGPPADRFLVARDAADARELASRWPGATIVPAHELEWAWPGGYDSIVIHVCALGPLHPIAPSWEEDVRGVDRDLAVVERVLEAYAGLGVRVVFVSSVLALVAPRPSRTYYSGWKLSGEALLEQLVERHPPTGMSVAYPGRLLDSRAILRPVSLLHTTYARMARVLWALGASGRARRSVVGVDARLLILAEAAGSCLRAIRRA